MGMGSGEWEENPLPPPPSLLPHPAALDLTREPQVQQSRQGRESQCKLSYPAINCSRDTTVPRRKPMLPLRKPRRLLLPSTKKNFPYISAIPAIRSAKIAVALQSDQKTLPSRHFDRICFWFPPAALFWNTEEATESRGKASRQLTNPINQVPQDCTKNSY